MISATADNYRAWWTPVMQVAHDLAVQCRPKSYPDAHVVNRQEASGFCVQLNSKMARVPLFLMEIIVPV